jgi:hypothetical protein
MLAGLPQMCADALASAPSVQINLVFDGPAAGSYALTPRADGWSVSDGLVDDAPIVRTSAHDFVSWGTKRADWRECCSGDVDNPDVAALLDAFNVI